MVTECGVVDETWKSVSVECVTGGDVIFRHKVTKVSVIGCKDTCIQVTEGAIAVIEVMRCARCRMEVTWHAAVPCRRDPAAAVRSGCAERAALQPCGP